MQVHGQADTPSDGGGGAGASTADGHPGRSVPAGHEAQQARPVRPRTSVDSLVRIVAPRYWAALLAIGVFLGGIVVWSLFGTIEDKVTGNGVFLTGGAVREVHTSDSGVVQSYSVTLGSSVAAGQPVVTIQLQNGKTAAVMSPVAGEVSGLTVVPGQPVKAGASVATLADPNAPLEAVGTVPAQDANAIKPGQSVRITPLGLNSGGLETVEGALTEISPLPVSTKELAATVGSSALAEQLTAVGPVKEVTVNLLNSAKTSSGYAVSNEHGSTLDLSFGMQLQLQVITSSEHPIDRVLK